jgi:hypothetical protein
MFHDDIKDGCPNNSVNIDQPAGYRSVDLWATAGTDRKHILIHSIQIGTGVHTVSYSMGVRGSYTEDKVVRT